MKPVKAFTVTVPHCGGCTTVTLVGSIWPVCGVLFPFGLITIVLSLNVVSLVVTVTGGRFGLGTTLITMVSSEQAAGVWSLHTLTKTVSLQGAEPGFGT